jgi:hypothetical protein
MATLSSAGRLAAVSMLMLASAAQADGGGRVPAVYHELLQQSMNEKFGLSFYVKGQVIPGMVTRIGEDGVVEARNQTNDRILIRLDRVDALAR